MKRLLLLTTTCVLFCVAMQAQNVFNPADPIVRYNSAAALGTSTNPNPAIQGLQKWVSVASNGISTGSGNWDASSYKAYFINLNGAQLCFRLKFPKSYTNADSINKKYPMMLFLHGAGEPGCPSNGGIYNNERQLTHGGKLFRDRVDNGSFDGFLIYPQALTNSTCSSNWGVGTNSYNMFLAIVDSLVKHTRADVDRLFVDGLSNGGAAAWYLTAAYPTRVAAAAPSAAATGESNFNDFVHIPIWFASGGKDSNPTQGFSEGVYNALKTRGSSVKFTLYPTLGHSVWSNHWNEPGFVDFMNAGHKANPLIFFQRDQYCPDSPINVKLGISKGFVAYEWQKDGVTIASRSGGVNTIIDNSSIISYGADGNEITVKAFGTYRVRFKRTTSGAWSSWSPTPAVISSKPVTQTPMPTINGLKSNVLPAPDGSATVSLKLPDGYVSYQWFQGATVVGNQQTFNAQPGNYTAKVVEQFGCGAQPSGVYTVISANGSPKPESAKNLSATTLSLTSIQLDWSDNPNAPVNETGFEIYRATTAGGPYQLVTIAPANTTSYANTGLSSNTQYYYIVRAIGTTGAAAVSNEADAKTGVDNMPPTAPSNLTLVGAFTNYANITWTGSTDEVGVEKYDVYVNGNKMYTTTETSLIISNLDSNQVYSIVVKARDLAGNVSSPSNQVTATTALTYNGLTYKYYEGPTWSNLPNFDALFPAKTGSVSNAVVTPRLRTDNFGFLWEGYINVPTTASYTFEVCSDDGSRLYVDQTYGFSKTPLINNDGSHGNTCKTGTITLTAGLHPIALAYFDGTGSDAISWSWQNNAGLAKQAIPSSVLFATGQVAATMTVPTRLVATAIGHTRINLTWADNSNNETGFEILRSTSANGTFSQVATVAGTSYTDSNLLANTKYFYKVRAIGLNNESDYNGTYTEANWKVNNSTADNNGNTARALTLTGATYTNAGVKEGTHALNLNGTNQYATINNSSSGQFPSDGAYTKRTVALWVKPTVISNNKVIFDFGSNANGLALRFTGGVLQAGIASASTRQTATASATDFNANWVNGAWNHVAVVYNVGSLKVYLNGVEVAANNALGFTSVAASTNNNSRLGYSGNNNADNAFNQSNTPNDYFGGQMDDIYVINGALAIDEIASLVNLSYLPASDTTFVTPSAPAAPGSLTANAVSGSTVNLAWSDNSNDETGFEIYRSASNNTNYRLIATVPAGTAAFSDTTLFANATYFYKVRATGLAAPSGYGNEVSAVTPNTIPAFANIGDFTIRYNTAHTLTVVANDPDGDALSFTTENLPYFAVAQNATANSIDIVSTPSVVDQGSYAITVYVTDVYGGKDTIIYNMMVNDNNLPVISPIANVTVSEGETRKVALVATDVDGNQTLVWTVVDKPSFATLVDSGNGRASVTFTPNLFAAGTYSMTVKADDGYDGWITKTFSITVGEKDPNETFQINMKYNNAGGAGWNDVETGGGGLFNLANLKNTKGATSTVGVNLISGIYGAADAGVQGGGVYPNSVMKDGIFWGYSWQGGTPVDTLRMRVYGLEPGRSYNFTFMGSNNCTFCGTEANSFTTYKIGAQTAVVPFYMNANKTDTIYQVQPNASGEVIITMIGDPNGNVGGTLNAFVIDALYDDSTTPVKPTNLVAVAEPTGVKLTWSDKAYNEASYLVYRATVKAGPYTLVNTLGGGATTYTDQDAAPFTQYFYYVAGVNGYGTGASSDTATATTANNKPVIAGVTPSLVLKTDGNNQDDFTVTDDAGDNLTVTIVNKPTYVTLQSLGGSNYRLIAAPTASDLGKVTFTVKVTDDHGGEATSDVTIAVSDKNTRSVYVNFATWGDEAPAPWNNIVGYIGAGYTLPNLVDENNTATPFNIQMVNGWTGISYLGHNTGNNTGVYPDVVLKSGLWDNTRTTRTIRFNNLDNSKRYNVVIVGSQNEGLDASARYSSGSTSDTLNSSYNTNLTGNLNNLTPVGGVITVNLDQFASATFMFITAIQLEEFAPGINLNPVNLYVEPKDRNAAILSWSDRSANEDAAGGFQLERATDEAFATAVAVNLPGNTTTYTSTGLAPNTKYWYRVRAKVGGVYTDWSNVGKTITPQAITYVNFNFATEFNAPSPWYNLAALPNQNFTFSNLPNQSNQPTSLSLSIEKTMNGDNNFGVITGNNSGVAPDVVLQSNYWIDNTQQSQVKLSGLNQARRYRIGFLGSMSTNGWFAGNYTCTYTINGRTVYLNSWMNSTKIVYIGNVQADANGEVLLNFSTTQEAAYGFNGGIIIEAYDDQPVGGTVLNGAEVINGTSVATVVEDEAARTVAATNNREITGGRMYPNPFVDQINLDFNNTAADNHVSVDVYDLSGKLMFRQAFGKLAAGYNTLRVNTGSGKLNTGIYMITLNVNGKPVQVSKMVKANK